MTKTRKKQQLHRNNKCHGLCGFSVKKLGEINAQYLHSLFEEGFSDDEIIRLATEREIPVTRSSAARHRRLHLDAPGEAEREKVEEGLSDLEALGLILKRAQQFIPDWKITPNEYFKALDMYYKLTRGSAFDGLMTSLAAAALDDEEEEGVAQPGDPSIGDFGIADG